MLVRIYTRLIKLRAINEMVCVSKCVSARASVYLRMCVDVCMLEVAKKQLSKKWFCKNFVLLVG